MKQANRVLIAFLVLFPLIFLGIQKTSAFLLHCPPPSGINVSIDYANYHDLDYDWRQDDVWTEFRIETNSGQSEDISSRITLYLDLPSGRTFYTVFTLNGVYHRIRLGVAWFDCAIESGWYQFSVYVTAISNNWIDHDDSSVVFDPPTKAGPGVPAVSIHILS